MTHVITLGETMLRLSPPNQQMIEQAQSFDAFVGGSESNVAVGLARLGWDVAWVSRMTDNPVGQRVVNAIREHGVDTSSVIWTSADRVGTYYLQTGPQPRGSQVIYDRAGSAMSRIQPADLPATLFDPARPGWLHTSGITLGLSETAAKTAHHAIQTAKSAGWRISFDVNYRAKLWDNVTATNQCTQAMAQADLIFIALRDAQHLFGTQADYPSALNVLQAQFPQATIVITLSADGACCTDAAGTVTHQPAFPAAGSGRVGGGDAFAAGFLSGLLAGLSSDIALAWGAAAAAYKYTIPGDMPLLDKAALQRLIDADPPQALIR